LAALEEVAFGGTPVIPYTQLRKDKRLKLGNVIPLPAPLTVYVEPTNRCNLSCDFCPQSLDDYEDRTGKRQDMSLELWAKVMKEIHALEIKSLKLYFFGEPLLHPQIGEMVGLAGLVCKRVELTTNGMALTPKIAAQLIDARLDYLRVSIYPTIPHPENVVRNVLTLRKLRDQSGLTRPVICAKVFSQAEKEAIQPLYDGIVDEIAVEGLHTIGSEFVQISQQPKDDRKACPYPFYNLVVKSNGDVVPCCVAWEDSLVVGNVAAQTLSEIWAGEPLARIHRLHLEGRRSELAACAKCDTLFNSPDSVDDVSVEEYELLRRQG
jgi:radical SAM protein with 4Fe4S-binding SPASM domain